MITGGKKTAWIVVMMGSLLYLAGCDSREPVSSESFPIMGTFATVSVSAGESDHLPEIVEETRRLMTEVEEQLSCFRKDSEISQINAASGKKAVPVSRQTFHVLETAKHYTAISEGAFDVTIGPLMTAWGFGQPGKKPTMPSTDEISAAFEHVGSRRLILTNSTAYLDGSNMRIDLGGIGKGLAVDICYERLLARGYSNILVNLGGNIRCGGNPKPARVWKIGVRNPFQRDQILGVLSLADGEATATSGNYERFVEINGERVAHIMDPRTGYPVKGMAGVTVLCPDATSADAMSTALFVLGTEKGAELISSIGGAALFVPDEEPMSGSARLPARIIVTRNFLRSFKPQPGMAARITIID